MTLADFLAQAGPWQWLGLLALTAIVAHGISRSIRGFRLWGNVTKTKTKNTYLGKEKL